MCPPANAHAAIVRLAEPIALTSVFPYAWQLVKRFKVGNEEDASTYSGLLISSFALAEAMMGMYWGGLSDRVGRKPVLLVGCFGTMISMLALGFSTNIWVALFGRLFGGALNGNIGVIQTMVGELVKKPEHVSLSLSLFFSPASHKITLLTIYDRNVSDFRFLFRHVSIVNDTNLSAARAYSIMPFVWSIGTIVGPCIGGTFADPHETWPDTFPRGSLFDKFPYLLPNLVCAALLFISIILGYFLLEETLPALRSQSAIQSEPFLSEETPLRESADAVKRPAVELRDETYGTFQDQNPQTASELEAPPQKVVKYNIFSNKRIMAVVISLSIYVSVELL